MRRGSGNLRTQFGWHHGIVAGSDHRDGHLRATDMLGDREPIAEQYSYRQPRIVAFSDLSEISKGRTKNSCGRRALAQQCSNDSPADRSTEVDRLIWPKALCFHSVGGGEAITCQAVFARTPPVPTVAAVVHDQYGESAALQVLSSTRPALTVSALSPCHQDRY